MNSVTLIGRLGADPEIHGKVTKIRLATDRWTGKETVTDWHQVVCFSALGERVAQYLRKGQRAAVRGKVTYSSWEKDGRKQYSTDIIADEVEFLSPPQQQQEAVQPLAPADIPF